MPTTSDKAAPVTRRRQAGLTLVELLVTMSIAVMLTGMILVTWFSLQDSFANQARSNEARDTTRDAVSRMVREIRDAKLSSSGGNGVYDATSTRVTVYTTFNDPGSVDTGFGNLRLTRFEYNASTHQLLRTRYAGPGLTNGQTSVLAEDVVNPTGTPLFTYWFYDATGVPTETQSPTAAQLGGIYAVELELWIDKNPGHPPAPVKLQSTAEIRAARQ